MLLRRLDERPRWWTLLAVGAGGLVVGLVAVRATLSRPEVRADDTVSEPAPLPDRPALPDPAPLPDPPPASWGQGAGAVEALADAGTDAAIDAGIDAEPDAGIAISRSPLTLRPGRVAYLRCEEPCPRDRDLERATWRAIESLRTCPGIGAGAGDLRVTVAARSVTELHLGPSNIGGDVVECVRPSLAGTPTTIDAQLIVSFRFELGSD